MITFIYSTCRKSPMFEWFVDSLYMQATDNMFDLSKIQIVLVDFELQHDSSRIDTFKAMVNNRFDFVHVEPKPSTYQGKYRKTTRDFFAAGSARNTGVCYAKHNYVAFIDDLSILANNSFETLIECANRNIVVGFAYKKTLNLHVKDGNFTAYSKFVEEDHRLYLEPIEEYRQIQGNQLYGYNACPLEAVLKINGYDEICNSMGQEDCHFGSRLAKAGYEIYYARNVLFYESEERGHSDNIFIKREIGIDESVYRQLMADYGINTRYYDGNSFCTVHFTLDLLTKDTFWTHGNDYDLSKLRETILNGGSFPSEFPDDAKTIDGFFLKDI
jgi:hypothetical protein